MVIIPPFQGGDTGSILVSLKFFDGIACIFKYYIDIYFLLWSHKALIHSVYYIVFTYFT